MSLLIKKHTDTLIEQTKTKPEETLELKMNEPKSFLLNPIINLSEEGKWLIAVTSFEVTNSAFIRTDANNSFSITILGHWQSKSAEKTINELNTLLERRSQNGFELHVKEVWKKGNQIKI